MYRSEKRYRKGMLSVCLRKVLLYVVILYVFLITLQTQGFAREGYNEHTILKGQKKKSIKNITGSSLIYKQKKQNKTIGMHLSRIASWSTQYPFLNMIKQSRPWLSQKKGAGWGKGGILNLDKNGWLRSLKSGQSAELVFLNIKGKYLPYTRFVVRYKGKGKIGYRKYVKIVKVISDNEHIIVVKNNKVGPAALIIKWTDPTDYIRDITIVPEKYIELFDKGQIFNPVWMERIKEFRIVRFAQWMQITDSKQKEWKNRPKVSDYSWGVKGVPLEVMIELANRIQAEPWFNMPHLANNNYIKQFAVMVKNNLNPGLTAYVEHSNEVWNSRFPQSRYAKNAALLRWGDDVNAPIMQWHGMKTATVCDIWKNEVFTGERSRVHCVLGVHTAWKGREKAALDCPDWVAEGNAACYKHGIDLIGITGYFHGCLNGKAKDGTNKIAMIRSWLEEPDGGFKKAFEQILDGKYFGCDHTLDAIAEKYTYHYNIARSKGLAIIAYEGGQHILATKKLRKDKKLLKFYIAINRDPRMKDIYLRNLNNWKDSGGTVFIHHLDFSSPSEWGSWGALEYLGQETSPKWEALTEFNRDETCWWDDC